MSNLPIPQHKFIEKDHTVIIYSNSSTALLCTLCGGRKAIVSYLGTNKDLIYSGERTCNCLYAPYPGGDTYKFESDVALEERRLLYSLYQCLSIEELRMTIPITPARNRYSPRFKEILDRLYACSELHESQNIIVRYASMVEQAGEL